MDNSNINDHLPIFTKRGRRRMETSSFFGVSISLILINLASIMERADENLLPAVYNEVSAAFNIGPTELGYLAFIRRFVQSVSSPVAGVLVLRYDRPKILAVGTLLWAISTAAIGVSNNFHQISLLHAVNGLGLAIVIPALQSFIADSYADGTRGTGFGLLNLVGSVGGIGGGVVATIMAGQEFFGMPGWRFAFIVMAISSSLIGLLVYAFVIDPRSPSVNTSSGNLERSHLVHKASKAPVSVWQGSWVATKSILRLRTFQVIVLQGIVGSLPWAAMVFFTMWFELIGFGHESTAALLSLFAIGCAIGSFLGGYLADQLSRVHPNAGRVMCAQFSAFMGVPFSLFLLKGIAQKEESWLTYAIVLFFMGLTISWCATSTNSPIFAEIVPPKHRTMIYAYHRAFEGSFSAFAPPIVGILAEKLYGYNPKTIKLGVASAQGAYAMSQGLLSMMSVPFAFCCLFYTPLYFTVKHDISRTAHLES